MSSGPTLTGETCIEVTKKRYVNLKIGPEDWCSYPHECKRRNLIFPDSVCDHCKHKAPLDIPYLIESKLKEIEDENS